MIICLFPNIFILLGKCKDVCEKKKAKCKDPSWKEWMTTNCPKTCNFCKDVKIVSKNKSWSDDDACGYCDRLVGSNIICLCFLLSIEHYRIELRSFQVYLHFKQYGLHLKHYTNFRTKKIKFFYILKVLKVINSIRCYKLLTTYVKLSTITKSMINIKVAWKIRFLEYPHPLITF